MAIRTNKSTATSNGVGASSDTAFNSVVNTGNSMPNHGAGSATPVLYNSVNDFSGNEMAGRDLLKSRLWHGVPQLSEDMIRMFEAAYSNHSFIFVTKLPKFMTTGIYSDPTTNMHQHARNLKALIERASTRLDGLGDFTVNNAEHNDGIESRKVTFATSVTYPSNDISITIHEFDGLPLKNAMESWITGIYDPYSEHGNFHGNLGIDGGWCLDNYTMSLLYVNVDPSWTKIQEAVYIMNMFPNELSLSEYNWTKGEHSIIQDATLTFNCNQWRGPAVTYAAEKYMNNKILAFANTSVYYSRQFVPSNFGDGKEDDPASPAYGFNAAVGEAEKLIDDRQFDQTIANASVPNGSMKANFNSAVYTAEVQK